MAYFREHFNLGIFLLLPESNSVNLTKDRKISQNPVKLEIRIESNRIPYGIHLHIKGKKSMNLGVDFGLSP